MLSTNFPFPPPGPKGNFLFLGSARELARSLAGNNEAVARRDLRGDVRLSPCYRPLFLHAFRSAQLRTPITLSYVPGESPGRFFTIAGLRGLFLNSFFFGHGLLTNEGSFVRNHRANLVQPPRFRRHETSNNRGGIRNHADSRSGPRTIVTAGKGCGQRGPCITEDGGELGGAGTI